MKEFKGDKRTKAYKEWKAKYDQESKGLGDTVEKITEATGIKKVVKFLAGEDCGCDERKEKLNKIFRYEKPECLLEEEYNLLNEAIETRKNRFNPEEQAKYIKIFERVFRTKVEGCSSCAFKSEIWSKLVTLYNQYEL